MKRIFVLVLCTWACVCLHAKPRTYQDAQQIATEFNGNTGITPKGTKTTVQLAYTKNGSSQPLYYVFNKGTGFVIVSADDRATEILGYSDAGSFDINNLPDNFRSWLGVYETELETLYSQTEQDLEITNKPAQTRTQGTGSALSPLLGDIMWDQGDPYNSFCPSLPNGQKTSVGCVATAMAQIMRYHRWPEQGTGSKSGYTTKSNGLKVDGVNFANTTYDWANMPSTCTSSSPRGERMAIATLMFHCGVSVEMDYGLSSGAYSSDVPNALTTYFGYNPNMEVLYRDYYTKAEWDSIVRKELNDKRPVYYSGSSINGGHAFVCDGYDANGLFHFNWGWSGLSNGYFALSSLTPSSQGIGGSSGGYNFAQGIIIGIQPEATANSDVYQLCLDTTMTISSNQINRTSKFNVFVKGFWNMGTKTFNGKVGPALYDESGNIICTLNMDPISLESRIGWKSNSYTENSIPNAVQNGNYRLYLVYQATGQSDYHIVRTPTGTPNYVQVTVSSDKIVFTNATGFDVDLQLDALETIGNLYQNKQGRFKYTITNNGVEYVSGLVIRLESTTNSNNAQWGTFNPVSIANGETQTFEISETIKLVPGEYNLSVFCDKGNSYENVDYVYQIGNTQKVNILATPTGSPDLQVLAPISFDDNNKVDRSNMNMTVSVLNKGTYFSGDVVAFIFPRIGNNSVGSFGYQTISIDANETRDITFSGAVGLAEGTYLVALYYYTNDWIQFTPTTNSELQFTLVAPTALNSSEMIDAAVYPNPVQDIMYLRTTDKANDISVYDLSGRQLIHLQPETNGEIQIPMNGLQAGTYMLMIRTGQAVKTTKIIKQ